MELILVALGRVMFAAVVVVVVVVLSAVSTRHNTVVASQIRFRVVVLSTQIVTTNIRKPIASCKCTIPSSEPFNAVAKLYIFHLFLGK